MLTIAVMMSQEVADYYKDYNLSQVIDELLAKYDFTNLPQTSMTNTTTRVQRQVQVTNPLYIALYNTVGPRSKKVSLGRLLEYGYNIDILSQQPTPHTPPKANYDHLYLQRAINNLKRLKQTPLITIIVKELEDECKRICDRR